MPILSNKYVQLPYEQGTSTHRKPLFSELENSVRQFKKVGDCYLREHKVNLEKSITKFRTMIGKSRIWNIDFHEDSVVIIPVGRGRAGFERLRELLDSIEFNESSGLDDKPVLAHLKNFYEQFLEWTNTLHNEPPPGFVSQYNRGRVNLLVRSHKGRHRYGS
jgi:hypothetical protein